MNGLTLAAAGAGVGANSMDDWGEGVGAKVIGFSSSSSSSPVALFSLHFFSQVGDSVGEREGEAVGSSPFLCRSSTTLRRLPSLRRWRPSLPLSNLLGEASTAMAARRMAVRAHRREDFIGRMDFW
ncbi:hypothetical protein ACHAW6_010915 [Cyclotella cf. meneghiniana]